MNRFDGFSSLKPASRLGLKSLNINQLITANSFVSKAKAVVADLADTVRGLANEVILAFAPVAKVSLSA